MARFYAFFSILTLFLINAPLSFMLSPGKWLETHNYQDAFFTETYLASFLLRLLMMLLIAGLFALLASHKLKDFSLIRYSATWFLAPLGLMPVSIWFFYKSLPDVLLMNLHNMLSSCRFDAFAQFLDYIQILAIFAAVLVLWLTFKIWIKKSNELGLITLVVLFMFSFSLLAGLEWGRELVRKPFVIYNYMYNNGLLFHGSISEPYNRALENSQKL